MPQPEMPSPASANKRESALTVFKVFLKLGFTSFGGPIAHLGYFREEFVNRRKWITDQAYADLVALCQFTPGPASSKVGIGLGLSQAGLPGAVAAWLAFTAPSALALILFGLGIIALGNRIDLAWLHGLLVVAVPVVAQAVWGMARNLTPDAPRVTLAALAAIVVMIWPTPLGFVGAIVAGGLAGWLLLKAKVDGEHVAIGANVSRTAGVTALAVYVGLSFAAHRVALARVQEFAASRGLQVENLGALPLPPSALRWSGLIRTPDGVYQAWFSLLDSAPPAFRFFADSAANSYIEAARALPSVKRYLWFARFPLVTYRQEDGRNVVDFTDLRFFARRGQTALGFTFRVTMDSEGRVLKQGWMDD